MSDVKARQPTAERVLEPVLHKYSAKDGWDWATVVLTDEGPGRGQVMINSSYGNWSYYWGAMGTRCIRSFLVGCDNGYLQSKLLGGRREVSGVFDEVATIARIKEVIAELPKEQAKAERELLKDADFDSEYTRGLWIDQTQIPEAWDLFCSKPEPQSETFLTTLWPALVALWKRELAPVAP
jgi:hypothetical protein